MGGGLLQLVAYGAQDIYLSGNPQITFFKVVYRRHTNFAIETIEQTFEGNADFSKKVKCKIARNGDLLSNIYLDITLPALKQIQNGSTWHGWVNSIGHALIKDVDLMIGGQLIDRQYGEWLEIWSELFIDESQQKSYKSMIGKYDSDVSLETNALTSKHLSIPLHFWFCDNVGLALPLIALQYHEIEIIINFRSVNELTKSDVNIPNPLDSDDNTVSFTNAMLLCDYIYLDTDERRRFAQVSHEYLITQIQYNNDISVKNGTTMYNFQLNLNHPCKELIWIITSDSNEEKNTLTGNNIFNFDSSTGSDTFSTMKLQLNGSDRMSSRKAVYYRTTQPYKYHTRPPRKHIYVYSFGLKPEEHQPSGSCNMSRIDNATMNFDFSSLLTVNSKIKVYSININVLRVMSGMAGLAYSN